MFAESPYKRSSPEDVVARLRLVHPSMYKAFILTFALLSIGGAAQQEQQFTTAPQCRCADIEECGKDLSTKMETCKTSANCMSYLSKIGDAQKIEKCLDNDHQVMMKLENCAKAKMNGELGCTNSENPQNLTIPLIPVIEAPSLDSVGEMQAPPQGPQGPPELNQYLMCVDQCSMADMDIIPGKRKKRSPINCAFKLKCALAPPSEQIQRAYSTCETELGINPPKRMAESCNCLKSAGVNIQC